MKAREKRYKLIGAYDSETTNIDDGIEHIAFPILHQLGLIDCEIEDITAANVEEHTAIELYRHAHELYARLDELADNTYDFVPVIACHNLAFDMYGLSVWLNRHDVKVLAKSCRKPITLTILDDAGTPRLVMWDTLVFTQKSLDYMGRECGYAKKSGAWDYDLVRTPETALTDEELDYARADIYALLAYLGYWCSINPDIPSEYLGRRVVTKTGVVRVRRQTRFSTLKGKSLPKSVGTYHYMLCREEAFSTDDELYTFQACTRGGFTFISSKCASIPFEGTEGETVIGYDATSQHPAQIVSHMVPVHFRKADARSLMLAFDIVSKTYVTKVLRNFHNPFKLAFCASFEFTNLRLKKDGIASFGIAPLASARCKSYKVNAMTVDDNEDTESMREHMFDAGYTDSVVNGVYEFGKLVSADSATLYLTELAAWEVCQYYDYDGVQATGGYLTMQFRRPHDMSVLSVMDFYAAKREFKNAMKEYDKSGTISNASTLRDMGIPRFVIDGMENGTVERGALDSTYLGLKSDLNALYGIEACNEYRREMILDADGLAYTGDFGVENKPKKPKVHYQMGQRIVGWSRIAQTLVMDLMLPYATKIINGDTDSVKVLAAKESVKAIESALHEYACAVDTAKEKVCRRVKREYPEIYDELVGIGHYVEDMRATKFCASWNKSYIYLDDRDKLHMTIAGLPTKNLENLAYELLHAYGFSYLCNHLIGYNVTYTHRATRLNARAFPPWAGIYTAKITDYAGDEYLVAEPYALALYPMAKTLNDTDNAENVTNMEIALSNNPHVNTESIIITEKDIINLNLLVDNVNPCE